MISAEEWQECKSEQKFVEMTGIRMDLIVDIGCYLHGRNEYRAAVLFFKIASDVRPHEPILLSNIASCLHRMNQYEESMENSKAALKLDSNCAPAWLSLGASLNATGELELARQAFEEAKSLNYPLPDRCYMGMALNAHYRGDDDLAMQHYRTALRINADNHECRVFLGCLHMQRGEWNKGLVNYESRFAFTPIRAVVSVPMWDGTAFPKEVKRVLVLGEQGMGDTIMMGRYASLLTCHYPDTEWCLLCTDSLIPIMRRFPGWSEIHGYTGEQLEADVQIPIMSLMRLVWLLGASDPVIPVVGFDCEHAHSAGRVTSVGICWRGNPSHPQDRFRSMNEQELREAVAVPGVEVVDLVEAKGETWEDTLHKIERLDLVISVDTAVAHLAGTMGKKTWLLNGSAGDWRWGLPGDECHWYPSIRIFQQTKIGDWGDVLKEVKKELWDLNQTGKQ